MQSRVCVGIKGEAGIKVSKCHTVCGTAAGPAAVDCAAAAPQPSQDKSQGPDITGEGVEFVRDDRTTLRALPLSTWAVVCAVPLAYVQPTSS